MVLEGVGPLVGPSEHSNEPLGSIKGMKFLDSEWLFYSQDRLWSMELWKNV